MELVLVKLITALVLAVRQVLCADGLYDADAVSISTVGFTSNRSQLILKSMYDKLLFTHTESLNGVEVFTREEKKHFVVMSDTARGNVKCDLCLLYLDPFLLANEDLTTQRCQAAFKSIYDASGSSDDKPYLLVVFPSDNHRHVQRLAESFNAAQTLFIQSEPKLIVNALRGADEASTGTAVGSEKKSTLPFRVQIIGVPLRKKSIPKSGINAILNVINELDAPRTTVRVSDETLLQPQVTSDIIEENNIATNRSTSSDRRTIGYYLSEIKKLNVVSNRRQLQPSFLTNSNASNLISFTDVERYLKFEKEVEESAIQEIHNILLLRVTGVFVKPDDFSAMVDRSVNSVITKLQTKIREYCKNSNKAVDKNSLLLAETRLIQELLVVWSTYFTKYINYYYKQMISEFNEEKLTLGITPTVITDLLKLKGKIVTKFTKITQQLTPSVYYKNSMSPLIQLAMGDDEKGITTDLSSKEVLTNDPTLFSSAAHIHNLDVSISNFIKEQEYGYQLRGMLPSSVRQPIELTFHTLLYHLLNLRDYRQDVLSGPDSGDEVILLNNNYNRDNEGVTASKARKVLQQQVVRNNDRSNSISSKITNYFYNRKLKEQSEYAREMLMLPLSVQDPNVLYHNVKEPRPQTKRPKYYPPSGNTADDTRGSAQVLTWDMPYLAEVKQHLNKNKPLKYDFKASDPNYKVSNFMSGVTSFLKKK